MKSKQNTPIDNEELGKQLDVIEAEVLKELETIPDTEGETNEC
jgi:hypothetical protein